MAEIVTIVEIDIPRCQLTYSAAPCEAELGVTGTKKCFNSRKTCQDTENFDPADLTLRFVRPSTDDLYDGIPSLQGVSVTPQVIDPGVSMGERESVSVTLSDHPHSDAGLDKYLVDRDYTPFNQGTFWGKLRARYTTFKGFALRVKRGEAGDDIGDFRTWHYLIESTAGPDAKSFRITAKDALKVADGDRAQAPAVSRGQLAADIDDSVVGLTLEPAGIGDTDYPSSGKAVIGGGEMVSYTRSGDVVQLTRGISGTEAQAHEEGESFQEVLEYTAESPADIIYDLLTTYTAADENWIPLTDWQTEITEAIGRLYTAQIAEPTPVRDLVNELIEQVGLIFWTDTENQQIRLTALRAISPTAATYDTDHLVEGTFKSKDQPKKRVSQAWTRFNLINPLEPLDEALNYRSTAIKVDLDSETEHNDEPAIKRVYSRWIGANNRSAAEKLNDLLIARYSNAPRRFEFALWRNDTIPALGSGVHLKHDALQDDQGAPATVDVQIISSEPTDDRFNLVGEEMLFSSIDDERLIVIDQDVWNINLRDIYDEIYGTPNSYDTITFVVTAGVQVGSGPSGLINYAHTIAMTVGDWPEAPMIKLINNGTIAGCGGNGRDARIEGVVPGYNAGGGGHGGDAIHTRAAITIENNGTIAGGGGGGGAQITDTGHGGGGGAGSRWKAALNWGSFFAPGGPNADWVAFSGTSDSHGDSGTLETGGVAGGATGGDGGDLGENGEEAPNSGGPFDDGTIGGGAGKAIDGVSFVTFSPEGDVLGPRVN